MNKQDIGELFEILFGLAGNFGDQIDKQTVKLWIRAFDADGITLPQIKTAALQILRYKTFPKMPTYGEFIKYIHGSPADQAQRQADLVVDRLRRNGARTVPEFEDPVTRHLMTSRWPWRSWAAAVEESKLVWWRKEFIEAYESYARNPDTIPTERQIEAGPKLKALTGGIG